jgi:hypothetical protein
MQYLLSVIDDTSRSATADEMHHINAFNDRLRADGHCVFAGGLGAPSMSTVVNGRRSDAMLIDGPSAETKEWLSGCWIVEAVDLDVALQMSVAGSKAFNRRVEVRPFL